MPSAVADDLGGLVDDAHGAVRPDDPVLGVDRRLGCQLRGRRRRGQVPIVRVDEAQEGVQRSGERPGLDAHDPAGLVGPPQVAGRDVPLPAADVGDPLGLFEMVGVRRRDDLHACTTLRPRTSCGYGPNVPVPERRGREM